MKIKTINSLPNGFDELINMSAQEEFDFLSKMKRSWESNENCFNKPGESLYGIFEEKVVIAICGRNIDPYLDDDSVGRVRHLYVNKEYRRRGLARLLVERVIEDGQKYFSSIRLRTHNSQACDFYKSLGFNEVIDDEFATHVWKY